MVLVAIFSRQKSGEVEVLIINPFKISDNTGNQEALPMYMNRKVPLFRSRTEVDNLPGKKKRGPHRAVPGDEGVVNSLHDQ
jgi:hypothetical protein